MTASRVSRESRLPDESVVMTRLETKLGSQVSGSGSAGDVARHWHTHGATQARAQVRRQLPSEGEEATEEAPHSSPSHSSFHCSPIPGYVSVLYRSQPRAQAAMPPGSGEGAARSQGALAALT